MRNDSGYREDVRRMGGDATWTIGQVFVRVILPIVLLAVVVGFFTRGFGLLEQKVFAPAEEQVRHDVFKNSQAYNDAMANEISDAYLEYQKADADGKAALRSVILHKVGSYDTTRLPDYLQTFITEIRQAR